MPLSPDALKQQLAARAQAGASGMSSSMGGAAPPGGPQGVFDVSNDGVTWHPAVRIKASTGAAFVVTNGEAVLTGQNAGMVEYADHAEFRASPAPADGTVFRIVSPCGEYRYSSSSGAGWADDDDTLLRPDSVNVNSNGRAFSTRASEHAATVAAFRAMKGLLGRAKHVHIESHTTFGDGGGGILDIKAVGSYVDNNGTIFTNGEIAGIRRGASTRYAEAAWFGVRNGSVDNSAALNAVTDYLADNSELWLPGGTVYIADTWHLTNRRFIQLRFNGTTIETHPDADFSGKVMVDGIGAGYIGFHDPRVYSTLTNLAKAPIACVAIGRTAANMGGNITMYGGILYGLCTQAVLYNQGSEIFHAIKTTFTGNNCPAINDNHDDPAGLCGEGYYISNYSKLYTDCTFGVTGDGNESIVILQGRTQHNQFEHGFFYSQGTTKIAINCTLGTVSPDPATEKGLGISVRNPRIEMVPGWILLQTSKNIEGCRLEDISCTLDAEAFIKVVGNDGIITRSTISYPYRSTSEASNSPVLKINRTGGAGVFWCDITVPGADCIEVVTGAITLSHIKAITGDPFFGAAWDPVANWGNIINVTAYGTATETYTKTGGRERTWLTVSGATPVVSGFELIKLDQASATDITNFLNAREGQSLTLLALDALSTIVHGGSIVLSGASSITMTPLSTLNLTLDGTVWRQV